jgi:putative membrane protein
MPGRRHARPPDDSNGGRASKHDLAEDRTEWAHRRNLMAKERTFAGWVRTAMSAIAVGLAAARLLRDLEPQWLVMALGAGLIVLGITALGFGLWSYRQTARQLERAGIRGLPLWLAAAFTLLLVVAAAAALALVFVN